MEQELRQEAVVVVKIRDGERLTNIILGDREINGFEKLESRTDRTWELTGLVYFR